MDARSYLSQAGLTLDVNQVHEAQQSLWTVLEEAKKRSLPATPSSLDRLYISATPTTGVRSGQPFDLGRALGGRTTQTSFALLTLDALVDAVHQALASSWLRIYQLRSGVLLRLTYRGGLARAQVPLHDETDPVARVARAGRAVLSGAEGWVPLLDETGALVGVIEASASELAPALLAALAIEAVNNLPP